MDIGKASSEACDNSRIIAPARLRFPGGCTIYWWWRGRRSSFPRCSMSTANTGRAWPPARRLALDWVASEKRDQMFPSGPSYSGAAGRNRTHDPLVRSQVLYPAELQPPDARIIAAVRPMAKSHVSLRGERTAPGISPEGGAPVRRRKADVRAAQRKKGPDLSIWSLVFWCGWQESNPRPLGS